MARPQGPLSCLIGLTLALGAAPALSLSTTASAPGPADDASVVAAAATSDERIVVNRDAQGDVLPPGLSRHVDRFCEGTTEGPRVSVLYVRESTTPDGYAAAKRTIASELAYIDDVFAVSSAATGGGRRVRWETDSSCAPRIRNVVVPPGTLSTFEATRLGLQALDFDRDDRKYLAFADVPQGGMTGGACGKAYKMDDDAATGNANDGTVAQHARIDRDCWSVSDQTYLSAALHELLHTFGAIQDSAPHSSQLGHCTDAADVMCYDDSASGGSATESVCPEQDRWQLDCGKDDYFDTDPAPGTYLDTHWNVADSSFLAQAAPLPPAPTGTVAPTARHTVAGEIATLQAAVPSGATVRWSLPQRGCDDAGSKAVGTRFTVRCFASGVTEVDATVVDGGPTATHLTVPVTFASTSSPRLAVSAPLATGAGATFPVSVDILNRKSGTWTTSFYARHADCSARKTSATSAAVTCGPGAIGASVLVGARARRTEDGRTHDRSRPVRIQSVGFPTLRVDGPAEVPVGERATFRASVAGATVRSFSWSSGAGLGTGARDRATYAVQPPLSSSRMSDVLSLALVLGNGAKYTLTTPYTVQPGLSVRLSGPRRVAAGQTGTFRALTNHDAPVFWDVQHAACRLAPGDTPDRADLRCDDGFEGDVVVTATSSRDGGFDSERMVVRAGGAPVVVKQTTRTVLKKIRRGFKTIVIGESSRVASATVVLKIKQPGRRWSKVSVARTNRRGVVVFRVRKQRRAVYRSITRAGTSHQASRSIRVRGR